MQFTVKGNQEKVIIRIQGINNLIADDYWDRNWISSEIEIILPGYHANFLGDIRTEEIFIFLEQLKEISQTLSGIAELNTMEGLINLKAEINNLGHIQWTGKTTYPIGNGNTLTFNFSNDQSFLSNLITELQMITKHFSIIGNL
ncbi:hypothetical protein H6F50_19305 [Coleofasciculus sp. FACHB-712]|uniref:WapI family immunity protein n=1 Tax=Coleofasciculus sp. FACHB-712 TaxID=2692789 RepID=UPI0016886874|nr:hypothetical protein [Coleofasciculus sp. FACHB-712]MBD1944477.1 hypothetical protein [Coleofasciculus sp. FACHB-712]